MPNTRSFSTPLRNPPHDLYNIQMSGSLGAINRSGTSGNYNYFMDGGRENEPVSFVSFWDAARFSNWLTTGDTETGVYNLGGTTKPVNNTITRDAAAWNAGGVAVVSEDEWYKAAYYSGANSGSAASGDPNTPLDYWLYPTASNEIDLTDSNYSSVNGGPIPVGSNPQFPSHYGIKGGQTGSKAGDQMEIKWGQT